MSWETFWTLNPHIINLMIKGHQEKLREIDYLLWLMGKYSLEAEMVALAHFSAGLAGKTSQAKYLERPLMQEVVEIDSEEEKQRAVDLFFAQESARRANWKRTHQKQKNMQ